jgi:hypothetical protein
MDTLFTFDKIALVVGIFSILWALVQLYQLLRFNSKGIRTTAVIKDLVENINAGGPPVHIPILEYKTEDGETITKRSYIGNKRYQQKIGDKVPIIYNPGKPDEFLLEKGMDKYWKLLGSLIMGVVFIAAALLQWF